MYYSAKRQQYLIDQGYTFKVVTNLCDLADKEAVEKGYTYSDKSEDLKLLRTLRAGGEMEMEKQQKTEDAAIRKNNEDGAKMGDDRVKRSVGSSMAQISGGGGMRYKETGGKGGNRHPLFAKRLRRK